MSLAMAIDETSSGAAYLSALKRSGSSAAGAATARAPGAVPSAETRPGEVVPTNSTSTALVEKRRSPRYKCNGSARLQEDGRGVTSWATLADISLHGCYVEAASTLRVGAVLGLRLEVNGFRVEAMGEVRVAYPYLGMGIQFIRMSEQDRERLRALVASISRSSTILGGTRTSPAPQFDALRAVTNPHAVLQAMLTFFEDRQMMGREEFLRILRKNQ